MCLLREYIGTPDIRLGQNPRVLNIGCGRSVKWNFLGVVLYAADQGLGFPFYVGVDRDEQALIGVKRALGDLISLVACDARGLGDVLRGPFQLVIVEHPDISVSRENARGWRRIFEQARTVLDDRGVLLLTSFWVNDHIPAQVALEKSLFRILYSGRNKYAGRQFDTSSAGEPLVMDKYLLIAKKG